MALQIAVLSTSRIVAEVMREIGNWPEVEVTAIVCRPQSAEKAHAWAAEYGVPVADAYARWKALDAYGVDTTQLLCNWINHPSRKMHALFADVLLGCIRENRLIKE